MIIWIFIEVSSEQSKKRAGSPNDKSQSLEYLIRGELIRACPALSKTDGKIRILSSKNIVSIDILESSNIFQNRNTSNRLSPTTQQRISSKRMR